jgi:hypothetical protein
MSDSDILTAIKAWLSENSLDMTTSRNFQDRPPFQHHQLYQRKSPTSFDTSYLTSIKAALISSTPPIQRNTDIAAALRTMMEQYFSGSSNISLSKLPDCQFIQYRS